MVAELLLGGSLLGGGAFLGWLWKVHASDRTRSKAEEAGRVRAEASRHTETIDRLSRRIGEAIKKSGLGSFRIGPFARDQGITGSDAGEAGRQLYDEWSHRAVAGGGVSPAGRRRLDSLADALEIDETTASLIEDRAKGDRFRTEATRATEGGDLTEPESRRLEDLRLTLGLDVDSASEILGEEGRPIYFRMIELAIALGQVEPSMRASAGRLRSAIFPGGFVGGTSRSVADGLYRKALDQALKGGDVDAAERELLAWLKAELRPTREVVEDAERRVVRLIRLSQFRSGSLPSISTNALLGSGELCHHQGPCEYLAESGRGTARHRGTLLVTSARVRFLSPEHSLAIQPSRIMDVAIAGRALQLSLDMSQGSAILAVDDPEEVAAILVGVVRRSKRPVNVSAESPGLVSQAVRRRVWDRDAGRCARCGRADSLEFGFVIAPSLGGASTAENLQILCRPCRVELGDGL